MDSLSSNLSWRGLIKNKTFASDNYLDIPKKFYWGVDVSSSSLQIGNLAAAMLARQLLEAGWEAIILVGGGTSLVGDPGGKTTERELQDREIISANVIGITTQLKKIFAGTKHEIVNNADWLNDIKLLDFLRDNGKYFPMSDLMQREFVEARLNEGISYAEFSYSLLQGYDFWWLFTNKQVELQIGASDQWGNLLSGVSLIRKKEGKEANAFSMPLVIDRNTGVKFGKSEAGAIWLDPAKTSPANFYQFLVNTSDEEVEEFLKVFTLLPRSEVEDIVAKHKANPSKRIAQTRLAKYVTEIVHGSSEEAKTHAENLRSGTGLKPIKLPSGISLAEALVSTGLATSNSDARRVVQDGGVYIDNEPTSVELLNSADFKAGSLLLRRGKKLQNSVLVELE